MTKKANSFHFDETNFLLLAGFAAAGTTKNFKSSHFDATNFSFLAAFLEGFIFVAFVSFS